MSNSIFNNAKLPAPNQIDYGEVAVSYVADKEALSIKNSNNEVVGFSSDKSIKEYIDKNTKGVLYYYSGLKTDYDELDDDTKSKSIYFATDTSVVLFNNQSYGFTHTTEILSEAGTNLIKTLSVSTDGNLIVKYANNKKRWIPLLTEINAINGNISDFQDINLLSMLSNNTDIPFLILDNYSTTDFNELSSIIIIDNENYRVTLNNLRKEENYKYTYSNIVVKDKNNVLYDIQVQFKIENVNGIYRLYIIYIKTIADEINWQT